MNTIANTIEQVALFHRVNGDDEAASLIAAAPDLAHMVAKLLQDAMRRQEIDPNAGTAARIAEAKALLATINGEG